MGGVGVLVGAPGQPDDIFAFFNSMVVKGRGATAGQRPVAATASGTCLFGRSPLDQKDDLASHSIGDDLVMLHHALRFLHAE